MKKRLMAFLMACTLTAAALPAFAEETTSSLTTLEQSDEGGSVAGKDGKRTKLTVSGGAQTELAPFSNLAAGSMLYKSIVFMRLAYWVGSDMYSDAAESIEAIDDYNYRVVLYEGIYDTDGNAFTASDLVYDLETAKEIGKVSAFTNFESATQEDDLTVVITMNSNISSAFTDLCQNCLLVTQAAYEASEDGMATEPVGTTQYRVTSFTASNSVVYEKVDDYWQTDESLITRYYEANVDVIEIDMLTEAAQKVSALRTGDIQIANSIGYVNVQNFVGDDDYYIDTELSVSDCMGFFFNMTSEGACADDLYLRQAVLYAIDKQSLLDAIGDGVTSKDFAAYIYDGYNAEWDDEDYFDYNPEKAMELLKQSNYNGETLRLLSSSTDEYKTMCEIIIAYLEAIGIKCEMVVRESAAWTSATYASAQEYDIMIKGVGYATAQIADSYKKVGSDTVSDIAGTTFFGWDNEEFVNLCNEVATVGGATAEKIEQIHDMSIENAIGMGLFTSYGQYVAVSTITDVYQFGTTFIPNATHFSEDYDIYAD